MNTPTHPGVIETVKDQSTDAIKGAGAVVESTANTAANVAKTAAQDTAKVGKAVGVAATELVTGAIKDVTEIGVDAEKAAAAVAGGAVKAVGEVASTTASTVHNLGAKPSPGGKAAPGTAVAR